MDWQDGFHGGFVGRMIALRAESHDGGAPIQLILKGTPPTMRAHTQSIFFHQCREAAFYHALGGQIPSAPHAFMAVWHWWSGDYTILLARVHGIRVGALLGNQCGAGGGGGAGWAYVPLWP